MEHLAILSKKRKLLAKILSGKKTIESRWYKFKRTPHRMIKEGEVVYFKESGEPITVKSVVERVLFFDNLDQNKIRAILQKYGKRICVEDSSINDLIDKNYCTLIFLKDVKKITPFKIDKTGYGLMSAWISVDDIDKLKIKSS